MIRDNKEDKTVVSSHFTPGNKDIVEDTDKGFQNETPSSAGLSDQIATHWRIVLVISGAILSIVAVVACLLYLRLSDQSGEDEIRASRGVADAAMALAYANFKQIQPQTQNWSYAEVIKANLHAILASEYDSFANFDAHGQFFDCPYMLRIYENSSLSHFIVIAQPEHGWLYSFMPKASIVIDSHSMELHKIQDLKVLNRLLVDSQSLDGVNAKEISSLVQRGELIPLTRLVTEGKKQGFSPPRALGLIHPGAENLVYNAPRYYLFGESVLASLLAIAETSTDRPKKGLISEELKTIGKFSDFVFYSSQGIEYALEARKDLSAIVPEEDFLVAYLQFSHDKEIVSAHLLMDDPPSDMATNGNTSEINKGEEEKGVVEGAVHGFSLLEEGENVDFDDRLFLQLSSIAHTRQLALMSISDEMIALLEQHSYSAQPNFADIFVKLEQEYMETSRDQDEKIFKKLDVLTREYAHLPAARFANFINATDLTVSFKSYLNNFANRSPNRTVSDEVISQQLEKIEKSGSWKELETIAIQTNQLLQFETIPDESHLIALQDSVWSAVAKKLNEFILPSESSLRTDDFTSQDFQELINILRAVWITNPQIYDFYTGAFGLRMQQNP